MKKLYRAVIITASVLMLGTMFVPSECFEPTPAPPETVPVPAPTPEPAPPESEWVVMDVSAYCLCAKCCGIWATKGLKDGVRVTASGVPAKGLICAAPRLYPFGTVFEVQGVGSYVCEDRGGAIKGNKLDLLFESHPAAINFGRQELKVRVQNEQ